MSTHKQPTQFARLDVRVLNADGSSLRLESSSHQVSNDSWPAATSYGGRCYLLDSVDATDSKSAVYKVSPEMTRDGLQRLLQHFDWWEWRRKGDGASTVVTMRSTTKAVARLEPGAIVLVGRLDERGEPGDLKRIDADSHFADMKAEAICASKSFFD